MLELKNIEKRFKQNQVLKGLNITVKEHELIYIYGINGCGKSTLFKIICDILGPDKGEVKKSEETKIGALIENPGFLENENLRTNLKFLANLTSSYHEEQIRKLCKRLKLNFDSRGTLKSYSIGMRQKVGIVQAVMENQNLILFDEPTRGLDADSIVEFVTLINELHNQNKTIIIASHDYLPNIHFTKKYELVDGVLREC